MKNLRRVSAAALASLAASALLLSPQAFSQEVSGKKDGISLDELKKQRTELAHRKRRIIMNNDGNEPVFKAREVSRKALLNPRTTALAGTQVDTIFYASSHGFSIVTHDSRVGTVWSYKGEGSMNLTPDFIKAGLDPLVVFRGLTREHGIELFWSFRVNDTHDAGRPEVFTNTPFKTRNPHLLMGRIDDRSLARGSWSAVDYGNAEVRDMALRLSEEVCREKDVDGIEWDFWRHALFFRNTALGKECGDEQREQMTDLVRRVRRMTEDEGMKRGRPILFSVRVPDSVEYCRAIGLDLEKWLEEDLFDLLVTTGYTRMNPWEYSVELAKKHGKPFYASLDDCRIKNDEQATAARQSGTSKRARALTALRAGADGIYTFNWYNPKDPFWNEGGDLALLNRSDKTYFASDRGMGRVYGLPYKPFIHIPLLTPEHPLPIENGKTYEIPVQIADDFREAGKTPVITLELKFNGPPPEAEFTFNGVPLGAGESKEKAIVFPLKPEAVKMGENRISLKPGENGKRKMALMDLIVEMKYGTP